MHLSTVFFTLGHLPVLIYFDKLRLCGMAEWLHSAASGSLSFFLTRWMLRSVALNRNSLVQKLKKNHFWVCHIKLSSQVRVYVYLVNAWKYSFIKGSWSEQLKRAGESSMNGGSGKHRRALQLMVLYSRLCPNRLLSNPGLLSSDIIWFGILANILWLDFLIDCRSCEGQPFIWLTQRDLQGRSGPDAWLRSLRLDHFHVLVSLDSF